MPTPQLQTTVLQLYLAKTEVLFTKIRIQNPQSQQNFVTVEVKLFISLGC
jgi:hypothetical protein